MNIKRTRLFLLVLIVALVAATWIGAAGQEERKEEPIGDPCNHSVSELAVCRSNYG